MPTTTDIGGIVASLRVLDEFSAPIKEALDQLAELEAALDRFKFASGGLSAPFTRLGSAIAKAQGPLADLTAKLQGLDGPIDAAADRLAAVQDRTAAIAAASAEAAKNFAGISKTRIPAAPGGGGHGGGGGFTAGAAGGGFAKIFRMPTMVELATAFVGYEAFKSALETNYHVSAGVQLFDPEAMKNAAAMQRDITILTGLARSSAQGTIYTAKQTAEAYDILAAMLSTAPPFQGPNKWQNFSALAPIVLRASEVATMRGLGSLQGNMEALTWFAHLTGAYDPASMVKRSNQLLAIAERTGVGLPRLERTMSYAVPVARGAGADMGQTALLTAALIQGGLGQRAGYAVGQIITGLLQTGGPVTAALQANIHAVNGALFTGKKLSAHLTALHTLGLVDAHGQVTALNAKGGVDLAKLAADIEAAGKRMSPTAFANAVHAAFGIRGMRGADLLSAMQALLPAFFKSIAETPGAAAQQAAFAKTPLQQFEQVWARLQDIGNVMATSVLPEFAGLTAMLLKVANVIDDILTANSWLARALFGGGVGALIGKFAGPSVGPALAKAAGLSADAGPWGWIAALGLADLSNLPPPWMAYEPPHVPAKPALVTVKATPPAPSLPADNHVTVTLHAPITVQGPLIGNEEELDMILNNWWGAHSKAITSTIEESLAKIQHQRKRTTFMDPAYSYLP